MKRPNEVVKANANRGSVLLRQPKAEDGEVATKEAQEKQDHDERVKSAGQVERPSEAEQDADRHAEEIKGQGSLPADPFSQRWDRQAAQDGPQRQQAHTEGRHAHSLRL
jgi:hypothetical protein